MQGMYNIMVVCNTPDIEQAYILRYAIDLRVHESCMCVAVRVLHSCAFI